MPEPLGNRSPALALIASAPLLLPLRGVVRGNARGRFWGGLLMLLFLMVAVMEAWAHPAQRLPALVQTALCAIYLLLLGFISRGRPP